VGSGFSVERHSEKVLILKMVLHNGLLNVLQYVLLGVTGVGRESFWNELFHLVSCIPQNKMVVLADVMNGHVGSSNVGYDEMHVVMGMELGMQMAPGSWSLQTG